MLIHWFSYNIPLCIHTTIYLSLLLSYGHLVYMGFFFSFLNPFHWKDWCWSWNSNTLVTWWEEPTHWKRPWCWERLRQEEKEATEDEMVGRHHWLNGHEFEQTLGDSEGQGSLACCSPWGHKELDTTECLSTEQHKPTLILSNSWKCSQFPSRGTKIPHATLHGQNKSNTQTVWQMGGLEIREALVFVEYLL